MAVLGCSTKDNTDVIAIGNGLMGAKEKTLASILQYTHMKTISKKKCSLHIPVGAFRKGVICANGEENQSVCHGDAGAPLIESKSQRLVGVASFSSALHGCGQGAQNFAYIPEFIQWIESIAGVTCKKDD